MLTVAHVITGLETGAQSGCCLVSSCAWIETGTGRLSSALPMRGLSGQLSKALADAWRTLIAIGVEGRRSLGGVISALDGTGAVLKKALPPRSASSLKFPCQAGPPGQSWALTGNSAKCRMSRHRRDGATRVEKQWQL